MRANPNVLRVGALVMGLALGTVVSVGLIAGLRPRTGVSDVPVTVPGNDVRPAGAGSQADGLPIELRPESSGAPPVELPPLTPAQLAAVEAAVPPKLPRVPKPLGVPRVRFVSQFDGGDFAGANCTLAAGAMLAELAFRVRTTGSVLRKHQRDQEDGTGLDDLQEAIRNTLRGHIRTGSISLAGLRTLSGAGFGIVLQGIYGRVPASHRVRPFLGPHAIYIDAFLPADASGRPSLYYVIDPLGRPNSTYDGAWWPAEIIEDFASAWAGPGRASAAWAPPASGTGVVVPDDPDFVPLPPSGGDKPGPRPPKRADGGPVNVGGDAGDDVVVAPTYESTVDQGPGEGPTLGGESLHPSLVVCLQVPAPARCPFGVAAVYTAGGTTTGASPPALSVLYADSSQPNVVFVGYTADAMTTSNVYFWRVDDPRAPVQEAASIGFVQLAGQPHFAARLEVLAGTRYAFVVMAAGAQGTAYSPVGTFTSGPGVKLFDITQGVAGLPVRLHDALVSPYSEASTSALALPFLACLSLSGSQCGIDRVASLDCSVLASFAGAAYCLPDEPLRLPAITACRSATVHYEIAGPEVTGVRILAYPTVDGVQADGSATSLAVVQADGPPGITDLEVGCLAQGLTYVATVDAIGDDLGPLLSQVIAP